MGKQVAQTLDTSCNQAVIVQNPLKGKTKNGWHFEQNVFDVEGLARTLKAGGEVEIFLKLFKSQEVLIKVESMKLPRHYHLILGTKIIY